MLIPGLPSACWREVCKSTPLKQLPGSTLESACINSVALLERCAYRHCLDLPHSKETEQAARNNLAQDLLLLGQWEEGWNHYAQRFDRKPGNHPLFTRAFGRSHHGPLQPGRPLLLMSEQGFGDTIQFSRYALHLQEQGFDVTLLSQPALVPLLRDAIGLEKVVDNLDSDRWAERQPIWMPLLNLLPALKTCELWTPFSNGYLRIDPERIQRWASILQRTPGK